jgi:hypothetical protein
MWNGFLLHYACYIFLLHLGQMFLHQLLPLNVVSFFVFVASDKIPLQSHGMTIKYGLML